MHGPPRQDEPWRELERELRAARDESRAAGPRMLHEELGVDAIDAAAPDARVWDLE